MHLRTLGGRFGMIVPLLIWSTGAVGQSEIDLTAPPEQARPAPTEDGQQPSDGAVGAAIEAEQGAPAPAPEPAPVAPSSTQTVPAVQAAPVAQVAPPPPRRITLRAIRYTPSFYLTDSDLAAISARFIGSTFTIEQLGAILGEINALYAQKGITLAEALLRQVDDGAGLVTIELFEATIGEVRYQSQNLSEAYLAFRLGISPGDPADNRVIAEQIDRLALTDGVAVGADFQPGAAVGTSDLIVQLGEQPNVTVSVTGDNYGSAATGVARLSAALGVRSLSGWGDPLSVSVTASQGSLAGSLAYSRVIHPDGTRIFGSIDATQSQTLTDPVITSRAGGGEIGVQHPFVLEQDKRVQGSFSALGFGEQGTVAGAPLVDQVGYGARMGITTFDRGDGWFLSTGQGLNVVQWSDGITGQQGIVHVAATGNIGAAVRLNDDFALAVQGAGQWTLGDRAPARLGFSVAGPLAVRGYAPNLSSGDSGFYLRTQIDRITPILLVNGTIGFTPYAFADIGQAYDRTNTGHVAQNVLASVGIGTGVRLGDALSGDIFLAKPLLDANGFVAQNAFEVRASLTGRFQ